MITIYGKKVKHRSIRIFSSMGLYKSFARAGIPNTSVRAPAVWQVWQLPYQYSWIYAVKRHLAPILYLELAPQIFFCRRPPCCIGKEVLNCALKLFLKCFILLFRVARCRLQIQNCEILPEVLPLSVVCYG